MSQVTARPGESFDSLCRRFKKAVERAGILADYRQHEFFEKPSVQKKRKKAAAKKRYIKRIKKTERFTPKAGGQNFRFNKDRTKKIPIPPPKKNFVFKKKPYIRPEKIKPTENKGI